MTFFLLGYSFLVSTSSSFDYLSQGWISSLHLLALDSMGVEQGSILQFAEIWIPFLNSLLCSGWFSEGVESINVGCYLALCSGCLLKGPHHIPGISISSFLQWHFYWTLNCIRNAMFMVLLIQMTEWENWGDWFKLGCGWGTGDVYYFIVFVFFLQFCLLFSYILSPLVYVNRAW